MAWLAVLWLTLRALPGGLWAAAVMLRFAGSTTTNPEPDHAPSDFIDVSG
jgi:hypothetical protein